MGTRSSHHRVLEVPRPCAPEDRAEAGDVVVASVEVLGIRDFVNAVETTDEFVDGGFMSLDLPF